MKNNITIIGRPRKKIGEFEFFEEDLSNPFFLTLLLISIDPTEKQKELLDLAEVKIIDANKKVVYPHEKKDKE